MQIGAETHFSASFFVAGGRGCGLIAARFLPPAGLNHIEAQALGTLDGEAVYFTRATRWFSGTRVCWTRMLPDRSEVQCRRNATFPAQGDNCQKAPRRAAPSW